MSIRSQLARRRTGRIALCAALGASFVLASTAGSSPASAAPGTIVYAYTSGFDTTGSTGCTTTADRCSLHGALAAAAALSSGTVAIYLEDSGVAAYQGESNALYSFADPGLDVTIEPDPVLGVGAVSLFDARYLPGTSILTLSGSGSVTLDNLAFDNADAKSSGGAVRISSNLTVTVTDCSFDHNQSIANSNGGAIGVDNGGTAQLVVTGSTFTNNWAIGVGGAIGGFANSGTTTIANSSFTDNHGDYGGAIGEGANGSGTLSVTGSTFEGNSAIWGGAIDNADISGNANATIADSTFVDNVASSTGGAVAGGVNSGSGNVVLVRVSIDNGDATTPAVAQGGGTVVFAGSIVAGTDATLCAGTISDAGYNLEADTSASCGFTLSSDAPPGSDPQFAPLATNGGTTLTEEVSAASPAAAAIASSPTTQVTINSTTFSLCSSPDVDQTGLAQSVPHGCTLGALDATHLTAQSTPTVLAPAANRAADQTFALTASGGSGVTSYVFSTATPGCSISGTTLGFTGSALPTTCEVRVLNPANAGYLASSPSEAQGFTFVAAAQAPLVLTSTRGHFARALTLSTSGGTGSGDVSYQVSDGSASGCTLSGSPATQLTTTSAGTCVVQATKAAAGAYLAQSSALSVVTIAATLPSVPSVHLVALRAGGVTVSLSDHDLGGVPETAVQYSINGGAWRSAIRLGHGRVEVTGLRRATHVGLRLRVYTRAGHSAPSAAVGFVAR